MDLVTLLTNLETNLTREIVSYDGNRVSYIDDTSFTVTVNSTSYPNVNRLCLLANEDTYLYILSYDFKKTSKINITSINSISIT